ncbi:hypothetical protein CWI36_1032p0010 [Hamiltosporidium magnivora]|uniref:Uncharacterized protein n=1 Tax=Hamiltosporidium magnivora TaxID=148818 RepID=A0A4Q9L6N8_9MICR|nr:hypothetical protein CWI36_1032p0010 [Hamiltosporidium magnivora]
MKMAVNESENNAREIESCNKIGDIVVELENSGELVNSKVLNLINRVIGEYAESHVTMTITDIQELSRQRRHAMTSHMMKQCSAISKVEMHYGETMVVSAQPSFPLKEVDNEVFCVKRENNKNIISPTEWRSHSRGTNN